ncbi:MAG: ribosome-associated translation inhibitor RaiA [Desulfobacterales bacterium]|nr:ribosome-associated translation inhibitor RaiA [Desulfobacterales bacterium]
MQTSVTFKNMDSSEPLREYVHKKLSRFDKLLDNPAEANAVLSVEKIRHIAEINLTGDKLNLYAREESSSMYSSIDMVVDKLKKQIKKSKQKIRDTRIGAKESIKDKEVVTEDENEGDDDDDEDDQSSGRLVVENIEYKPMNVEEAILQFDLVKESFLVFTNSETQCVNILFRRKDGDVGLLQPNP